ncbi:PREDICTED: epsin-2-like [Nicrophorus vespilloides]|uniref:Epsin-2-like n=1 Tax=Nicrophorus vespilloides TaxID=110193 RepID=A0ABM1MAX3_NICVS|nr:PREDICTED: epsin-2-like [Nicrophorus vespilloides]
MSRQIPRAGPSGRSQIISGNTRASGLRPPSASGLRPPTAGGGPRATSSILSIANKGAAKKPKACKDRKKDEEEAAAAAAAAAPEPEPEVKLPAFSMQVKSKKTQKKEERIKETGKKKMMRRNKPAGEDLNQMKEIMKSMKGQNVSVQEFIGLISPSTGDNGQLLRDVLNDEMNTFRNTSRKIYETMSQDVSDVLTNQHIQLTEHSHEMYNVYSDKMMRAINEINQWCPDFDFDKYYTQVGYLDLKFPLAQGLEMDEDQQQALLRQEAYHRYQWLKTEGERMKEENSRLQDRMKQLKRQQREEMKMASIREQQAEDERKKLEQQQEQLEDKLEELNESVEKIIVEKEVAAAEEVTLQKKKSKSAKLPKPRGEQPKDDWAVRTAADMESTKETTSLKMETSKVSLKSKASRSRVGIKKKKVRAPPPQQEGSPFHYSPPKSPQAGGSRQQPASPFHYSPVKSPPASRGGQQQQPASPFHYSPPRSPPQQQQQMQDEARAMSPVRTTMQTTTTVENPQSSHRGRAPRDSWGGFY